MRVLVCGSRTWDEGLGVIESLLDGLLDRVPNGESLVVIEGGARGADARAARWVQEDEWIFDIEHLQYRADWDRHGKAAGVIRNRRMLNEGKPDVVFAFTDKPLKESRGTLNMVTRAEQAGVPVYHVQVLNGA
jgi:hypothetical protein